MAKLALDDHISIEPARLNLGPLGHQKTVLPEDSYLNVAFSAAT